MRPSVTLVVLFAALFSSTRAESDVCVVCLTAVGAATDAGMMVPGDLFEAFKSACDANKDDLGDEEFEDCLASAGSVLAMDTARVMEIVDAAPNAEGAHARAICSGAAGDSWVDLCNSNSDSSLMLMAQDRARASSRGLRRAQEFNKVMSTKVT